MPQLSLTGNFLTWMAQSCAFALVAALLPLLFRVGDPAARVVYGHAVIAICLLLPLLQPWKHLPAARLSVPLSEVATPSPVAARPAGPASANSTTLPLAGAPMTAAEPDNPPPVLRGPLLFWLLAGGALLRLGWMLAGLWRIRSYRIAATPLYPVPETLRAASAITHADALFCISEDAAGPVMLGWLAPVILLPASFLHLSEESQCGIGCHELLHVRRGDWLVALLEECLAALLWFNPGVWLLLSQTRLAREQLVDAEAVRLTGAREQYIEALLSIARVRVLDLAPAPLFLRRRHLSQRMHALLSEKTMSKSRILGSYCSMGVILAGTAWLLCVSFPLLGDPAPTPPPDTPPAVRAAVIAPPLAAQIARRPVTQPSASAVRVIPAPVPPDAHEPVTGGVQVASTPSEHAAALYLLERARQNSLTHNRGMQPFHFTVSFTSSGSAADTGAGQLTEIWMNGQKWRWTATLGSSSIVRIASQGHLFENSHATAIPMRGHMLRNEIFWAMDQYTAKAQLRTAQIQWNGKPATCILASGVTGTATQAQGRLWEEEEYCVDNDSGLLLVHSIAPGTFAVFGYGTNQQFHGRTMPDRITLYVNQLLAADASFSITDTGSQDEASVTPAPEMTSDPPPLGVQLPVRMAITAPAGAAALSSTPQSVMVHAQVNGEGKVIEEELSATGNPALTQAALDLVKSTQFGYTGTQRQMYLNVVFGQ